MEDETKKIYPTKNYRAPKLKRMDYILMLAFATAILLALVGAVVSSIFFY